MRARAFIHIFVTFDCKILIWFGCLFASKTQNEFKMDGIFGVANVKNRRPYPEISFVFVQHSRKFRKKFRRIRLCISNPIAFMKP